MAPVAFSEWAVARVKRGVKYAKAQQYAEAIKCYDQALSLDSANVDAYVARGAARANTQSFRAAIADFQRAIELDPGKCLI